MKRMIRTTLSLTSAALLVGCAATQTILEHRTLEVSTKQSDTIFLDPVSSKQKTVFVSVKNTSDQVLNITPSLKAALQAQGYRVVNHPDSAHYLLQANILKVGKMSIAASQTALGGGYGSALVGAGLGTGIGALTGNDNAMIGGGIAGGVIGLVADSVIKDVNYTMITDVQISERTTGVVKETFNANLINGNASNTYQTLSQDSFFKRYKTRIVSNADKVNLAFVEARPALENDLVKSLSGLF